jgi:hypothetical protein
MVERIMRNFAGVQPFIMSCNYADFMSLVHLLGKFFLLTSLFTFQDFSYSIFHNYEGHVILTGCPQSLTFVGFLRITFLIIHQFYEIFPKKKSFVLNHLKF